ncbi:TfoX/Sxy family protein [Candidatus Uhrbacteria bacterium]|nr:TfoX/Sxy family protein [Candidatus Uhrbacteria bacterium]
MAYDEELAQRVHDALEGIENVTAKKMFGAHVFMIGGHMTVGVDADRIMLRVGKDQYDEVLAMEYVSMMNFTGKPLTGFVFIDPEGFAEDDDLQKWVNMALSFTTSLPPKVKK